MMYNILVKWRDIGLFNLSVKYKTVVGVYFMFLSNFNIGANVTFTGIAIVFLMLVLLVLIISVFGLFSKNKPAKSKPQKQVVTVAPKDVAPTQNTPVATEDDTEIIAVIAAAVAAMYDGTGIKPVIKSVKPASGARSAWAMAGIIKNTRAF